MKRWFFLPGLWWLFGTLIAPQPAPANSFACPVSLPLSKEDRVKLPGGSYGTESFSTGVWPDGKIVFKPGGPGFVMEDGSLAIKFPWFWTGGRGELKIEGRRLDAAAPLRSTILVNPAYGNGFQPSSVIFPTPGCWEITGRVLGRTLTLVTEVIKVGEGPGKSGR